MSQMTRRTSASRSIHARVVISPATTATPVLTSVFAGDARLRIAREEGVQHRVRDLVGDLVRMPFGDGLGGE